MSFTKSYHSAVSFVAENAPDIENHPGKFIRWAEDVAGILTFIYSVDYDQVTTDITDKVKELQDYED
jgi:hypothetical protein